MFNGSSSINIIKLSRFFVRDKPRNGLTDMAVFFFCVLLGQGLYGRKLQHDSLYDKDTMIVAP